MKLDARVENNGASSRRTTTHTELLQRNRTVRKKRCG